jgi:hypothetical protein
MAIIDARDRAPTYRKRGVERVELDARRRAESTHKRGAKRRGYSDDVQLLPVESREIPHTPRISGRFSCLESYAPTTVPSISF